MESTDEGAPSGVQGCGDVRVGHKLLKNAFNFSYIGSDPQANGDHSHAMKVRMGQAKEPFGSMWQSWGAPEVPAEAKLK